MMKNSAGKVLIAAPVHPVLTDGLTGLGYECVFFEKITQAQAYGVIADCVGVVTSTRLMLDKALLDVAVQLRWIGRMGSGMEVVDVAYAKSKGINCFSSPEGNCNAVGEHALGMLLALNRKIVWSNNEINNGIWRRDENRGTELEGKTVGIIGYGHTGAAFARKLLGFDATVCTYDKYRPEGIAAPVHRCETLEELCSIADIVSFHVPLLNDTVHYVSDAFIAGMRKPFILINTSRGPVVDTTAVLRGLTGGKITGVCLDVFETEPLNDMPEKLRAMVDEIAKMPNAVVTPHIAGYTFEALYKMSKTLYEKLIKS